MSEVKKETSHHNLFSASIFSQCLHHLLPRLCKCASTGEQQAERERQDWEKCVKCPADPLAFQAQHLLLFFCLVMCICIEHFSCLYGLTDCKIPFDWDMVPVFVLEDCWLYRFILTVILVHKKLQIHLRYAKYSNILFFPPSSVLWCTYYHVIISILHYFKDRYDADQYWISFFFHLFYFSFF